jgi:hypothetical protein
MAGRGDVGAGATRISGYGGLTQGTSDRIVWRTYATVSPMPEGPAEGVRKVEPSGMPIERRSGVALQECSAEPGIQWDGIPAGSPTSWDKRG